MLRRLEMKRDAIASGRAKIVHVSFRLDDHEVGVEASGESLRKSPTIFGPQVMFGTNRPSMMSRCR